MQLYALLSEVDWGNRIHYKTFVCLGSALRGMVRGGALSVPCLEPAAYLIRGIGDESFVIWEGSLHIDVIYYVLYLFYTNIYLGFQKSGDLEEYFS